MWTGEIRRFASLSSTNGYLLEQARAGADAGLVVVADHQSAGRGRLGRSWESPPGSGLLMSVLLRPVLEPQDLYLCTVVCALALAAGCEATAGVRPRLKWPNDLVIDDAKLAGILAESDPGAPGGAVGSVAVVVGMGCNLTWPGPPEAGGTSLSHHAGPRAAELGRDQLLAATFEELGHRLPALDDRVGRRSIVDELREASATLGRTVRVTRTTDADADGDGAGDLVGLATALTDGGHLVVQTGDGEVEVAAGDVVHLRPTDR